MVDDDDIHDLPKLGSDPPPDADAHNAPTKVGPMAASAWAALIEEAGKSSSPDKRPTPMRPPPAPKEDGDGATLDSSSAGGLPRTYNESDEDDAATLVHPSSKLSQTARPVAASTAAEDGLVDKLVAEVLDKEDELPVEGTKVMAGAPPRPPPPPPELEAPGLTPPSMPMFAPPDSTALPDSQNPTRKALLVGAAAFVVAFLLLGGLALLFLNQR